VEEDQFENEIAEMYDDFPSEFSSPVVQSSYAVSSILIDTVDSNKSSFDSIRHSGISQLEEFLKQEETSNESSLYSNINVFGSKVKKSSSFNGNVNKNSNSKIRAGAINRLGHSSAVDQLKKLL